MGASAVGGSFVCSSLKPLIPEVTLISILHNLEHSLIRWRAKVVLNPNKIDDK